MKHLYYNGTIITVNDDLPLAEALMVEDGKILAVGDLAAVSTFKDDATLEIDLEGKTVLPGFIDGHGHIANVLSGLPGIYPPPNGVVDSKEALFAELKKMLEENRVLENGWLVGFGYDEAFFEDKFHPTRMELDQVSTDVPIFVIHCSGHLAAVNSKAIELVGWTKDTPDPVGGVIRHDPETGEINGILEERAFSVVLKEQISNKLSNKAFAEMILDTQKFYAKNGVTTAQEGGITFPAMVDVLKHCQENNMLLVDIGVYFWQERVKELIPDHSAEQTYHNHIKWVGAKVVADGSPQAKTAWLTQPYYIRPEGTEEGYRGYQIYSDEQMLAFCKEAMEHEWQMLVHCNGDATGDQFIRAYRQAKEETGCTKDLRPVMVHAQTVREDQLDEMKELGIMPSFFHDHVFYWGDWHYESVFGPERGSRISPLASAVKRGMKFTLHNDMAVTPINPVFNIHNAVNRVTRNGRKLGQEYCIDVMEAIKAVTIYGAYQYFDENIKGSLEVGKLADMVILDKNPLTVPKETIKDIKVLETIKEGNTIYRLE